MLEESAGSFFLNGVFITWIQNEELENKLNHRTKKELVVLKDI